MSFGATKMPGCGPGIFDIHPKRNPAPSGAAFFYPRASRCPEGLPEEDLWTLSRRLRLRGRPISGQDTVGTGRSMLLPFRDLIRIPANVLSTIFPHRPLKALFIILSGKPIIRSPMHAHSHHTIQSFPCQDSEILASKNHRHHGQ